MILDGIAWLLAIYFAYKHSGGFWRYAGYIIIGLVASGVLRRILFPQQAIILDKASEEGN